MPSPESSFSFFGRGKKDKGKSGEPMAGDLASKETPETVDSDEVVLQAALATCEQLISDAERFKKTKKGVDMLDKITSLVDLVEKAKSGDARAMAELREDYTRAKTRKEKSEADLETAREILGKDCFGPEAVKATFGIEIPEAEIPPIPFTKEDLERAEELGQMLILRTDTAPDGAPLTMPKMYELLQDKFTKAGKGKVLADPAGWKKDEEFFKSETPAVRWALVSKEVIPNSTSKNYLEQTEIMAKYLIGDVFKDKAMPEEYQAALDEFQNYFQQNFQGKTDLEIQRLLGGSDWKKYAQELGSLKINQLTRQTPAEALYDILVHFQITGERILERIYTWTRRRSSGGGLVRVGGSDANGVRVDDWGPGDSGDDLGVAFSRSL